VRHSSTVFRAGAWAPCTAFALAALLVGTLAGQAGAVHRPSPIIQKAVRASLGAHSADMTFDIALSAPGQGTYRLSHVRGDETFSGSPEANFTVTIPNAPGSGSMIVREVITGGTLYVNVNGQWYSTSLRHALGGAGITGSLSRSDPAQTLELLQQAGSKVTRIGSATVGGVPSTEYRAVIDLDRATAAEPAKGQAALTPALLHRYEQLFGLSRVPTDVWIDQQGRIREMKIVVPLSVAALAKLGLSGAPSGITESVTIGLSDFGVPVTATPPPTSEVQPLPLTGPGSGTSL
jgi:hypothetical protein